MKKAQGVARLASSCALRRFQTASSPWETRTAARFAGVGVGESGEEAHQQLRLVRREGGGAPLVGPAAQSAEIVEAGLIFPWGRGRRCGAAQLRLFSLEHDWAVAAWSYVDSMQHVVLGRTLDEHERGGCWRGWC